MLFCAGSMARAEGRAAIGPRLAGNLQAVNFATERQRGRVVGYTAGMVVSLLRSPAVLFAAFLWVGSVVGQQTTPPIPTPAGGVPSNPAAVAKWFPVLEQRLEIEAGAGEAKGVYAFSNPAGKAIEWKNMSGSCTCTRAVILVGGRHYELQGKTKQLVEISGPADAPATVLVKSIEIPAGAEGTVELHIDSHGAKGEKLVSFDIHSTDSEAQMFRLQLHVNVLPAIHATPSSIDLGVLPLGETREFSVKVVASASVPKDWKIRGASPFPKGATATYERVEAGADSHWLIKGSYRQDTMSAVNVLLEFQTNVPAEPTVHIRLQGVVKPVVELTPGFFALGKVSKTAGAKASLTIHAADGRDLQATSVHLEGVNVPEKFVTARTTKSGVDLVLELEVAPDAPIGLLRGGIVLELNHPGAPKQTVLFNGFVR